MVISSSTIPSRAPIDFSQPMFAVHGVAFDLVEMDVVIGRARAAFENRLRLVLSTPNVNNVVAMQRDGAFRDAVSRCDLIVADGMPIVWIARMLGVPARRIAGSDFFERLMKGEAGARRVFFFGGPEGIAARASDRLDGSSSALKGAGGLYPGFGSVAEMASPEVAAAINASAADFLVVALGTAKGQSWIEHIQGRLNVPLISHLGAVVNFAAGTVRRAPRLLQVSGGEWLWRIWEEPALWRRYFDDAKVLFRLLATSTLPLVLERMTGRLRGPGAPPVATVETLGAASRRLVLEGDWFGEDAARSLGQALNEITAADADIEILASRAGRVDLRTMALLIRLRGLQTARNRKLTIRQPSATFLAQLERHCAGYLVAGEPPRAAISAHPVSSTSGTSR
jgi:N-acetylglucosaminyldiphosphoundecaprenol N-acetyl-beta-D-mannosaminyltransferase